MRKEKESGNQEHPGIKVPKASGEKAIRYLTDKQLIDRGLRIESSGNEILVPLIRRLTAEEESRLKELGSVALVNHAFSSQRRMFLSLSEAIQGRIPDELMKSLPTSYDIIGDIAILDLPPSMTEHETVLAEAIRLVNKNVRVVVTKTGAVSGSQRILPTRHLAGEVRTTTVHKESGCLFKVDIAKAFFSPRLSYEHERVANLVEDRETVTDLFAGVGPFSILIAKKLNNVSVNAIDSNPDAIFMLRDNAAQNKVLGKISIWSGDAREVVDQELAGKASRVIMNNPSAASGFVDVACKALRRDGGMLHYYTFKSGESCEEKAVTELETRLKAAGWRVKWLGEARRVREVGPMKWQVVVDAPIIPLD